VAIAGFLVASVVLHALCFYLFQVVYPPAISLLPPPARVSVIAPTSDEARTFLSWLAAEDPALASQTQRPADAPAFRLPKLAHVPSYVTVPPKLKELPPVPTARFEPSAMPPAPVPAKSAVESPTPLVAPTTITFSGSLGERPVSRPAVKFRASLRDAPQSARFRIAVDSLGIVRYALLDQSSSDAALDEQARHYLALCRFESRAGPEKTRAAQPSIYPSQVYDETRRQLTWATAVFDFGNDLELPPAPEPAP
jgi:hypothetical protein